MFETFRQYCSSNELKPARSIKENFIYNNDQGVPVKLGRWIHTQKKLKRTGKLRADRVAMFQTHLIAPGYFRWPIPAKDRDTQQVFPGLVRKVSNNNNNNNNNANNSIEIIAGGLKMDSDSSDEDD